MNVLPDRCVMCGGEIRDYHSTCHWRHSKEQREGNRDKNYDYLAAVSYTHLTLPTKA